MSIVITGLSLVAWAWFWYTEGRDDARRQHVIDQQHMARQLRTSRTWEHYYHDEVERLRDKVSELHAENARLAFELERRPQRRVIDI